MEFLYIVIVFLICAVCAIAGIGGGVIIKPLFDAVSSYDSTVISMISLFAVLSMSVSGVIRHLKMKTAFDRPRALRIAIGSMLGGIAGQLLFGVFRRSFPDPTVKLIQNILLFLLLAAVLVYTLLSGKKTPKERTPHLVTELAAVFLTGLFAAFVGIGGGPINICLVCLLYGISVRSGAVYSLLMIVFSQSAKLVTCLIDGTVSKVEPKLWILIAGIALAGIAGGLVGAYFNKKLKALTVSRIYLAVLILIILIILYNILRTIIG